MKSGFLKITGFLIVSLGLGAFCFVLFSGIKIHVENHSQKPIENIEIDYGRGAFIIDQLAPFYVFKKDLGKIGEGADFSLVWNNSQKAKFNVYFDGHFGNNRIRIVFLPSGQVIILDNDRIYEST